MYFLIRRGSPTRASMSVRIPLIGILILYLSTGTYIAALIWNLSSTNRWTARATAGLSSPSYDGRAETTAFQDAVLKQSWMLTLAAILNFVVGDAIVWWRASVIYQHKAVSTLASLLVTLTLVFGVVAVYVSARGRRGTVAGLRLVLLLSPNACAFVAVSLSLATNVLATALIAYQAWKHRRLVKAQFAAAGTRSQVLQVFALLVESGSIYCVIMAFSVVTDVVPLPATGPAGEGFYRASAYITRGCVIPLAAIYPAIIVVLVALQRSPIDIGGLSTIARAQAHAPHVQVRVHGALEPGRGQASVEIESEHVEDGTSGANDTDTSTAVPSRPPPRRPRDDLKEDPAIDAGLTGVEGRGTSSPRPIASEPWMAMSLPVFLGSGKDAIPSTVASEGLV